MVNHDMWGCHALTRTKDIPWDDKWRSVDQNRNCKIYGKMLMYDGAGQFFVLE